MTHLAAALDFAPFNATAPLANLRPTTQERYVRGYLADLGAKVVITEPRYFDRDYLAEFSDFFGASARGYPNVCRRLHFFGESVDRDLLERALNEDTDAIAALCSAYLGFVVVKPIAGTPFGRSVLKMYDSAPGRAPRCTAPARIYRVHLAGLELQVSGVAWQQQDAAVSTCATVALWSMLQSSAFDEHHAIPTTTTLTRLANEATFSRGRVFPSDGLTDFQLSRAIRSAGLEPLLADPRGSAEVFSAAVASLVRSRFPVLLTGNIKGDGHAICVVGFRESTISVPPPGQVVPQDTALEALYVHDDNLGPNVRFEIAASPAKLLLQTAPPSRAVARSSVTTKYPPFEVELIVAAVPDGLRVSVTAVHRIGAKVAGMVLGHLNVLLQQAQQAPIGFTFTARFARAAEYLGPVLQTATTPGALGRARLRFAETVPPTSLFVAVVRVGVPGVPLFDLVFDTSDSDHHLRAWATVAFAPEVFEIVETLAAAGVDDFGTLVDAS